MSRAGSEPANGPGLRFRTAVVPLLLYHVLVLVGGALVIVAIIRGPSDLLVPGAAILVAGVVAVVAVLAWTGRLARRAASGAAPELATTSPARWVCYRCANAGTGQPKICPRCGGWLIRSGARSFRD